MNPNKMHFLLLSAFTMAGCATTQAAGVKNDSQTIALEQQAKSYENDGEYESSTEVYRQLIAMHPNDFRSVSWQQSILNNAEALSDPWLIVDEAKQTLQRLVQARDEKFDGATPEAIAETQKQLEAHLSQEAKVYHIIYNQYGNPAYGSTARNLYGLLIEYFPDSDNTCDTLYMHADLEYWGESDIAGDDSATSHYQKAGQEFDRIVDKCTDTLEPSQIVDAAHSSMLAYNALMDNAETCPGIPQTPEAKEGEEQVYPEFPIAECRVKFIDAAKRYFNIVQQYNSNQITFAYNAIYKTGRIYFEHNQFDNAISAFKIVIEKETDSKNTGECEATIYAANYILESYKNLKQYKNMLDAIHEFKNDDKIMICSERWLVEAFIEYMNTCEEAIAELFKKNGEAISN